MIYTFGSMLRFRANTSIARWKIKWLGGISILLALLASLRVLAHATKPLLSEAIFKRDFVQEYLLARAAIGGVRPYQPLPTLATLVAGSWPVPLYPHPTPHPPPVLLLALPFGLMQLGAASVVWFLFELACLGGSVHLILTAWGDRPRLYKTVLITFMVIPFLHFWEELGWGQLMIPILFLLTCAWRSLRSQREITGGVMLGLAIATKLIAWPLVALLVLLRRWRAAFAACTTAIVANVVTALLVGPDEVLFYYRSVSKLVMPFYQAHKGNISLMSIGWRLFDGTGSPILSGVDVPPLIELPQLAQPVSLILVLLCLAIGLKLALDVASFDAAFGIVICVCILASPISWTHYLVLLAIPLAFLEHQAFLPKASVWHVVLPLILVAVLSISEATVFDLMVFVAQPATASQLGPTIPFAASLISLIPSAALIALILVISWSERMHGEMRGDQAGKNLETLHPP